MVADWYYTNLIYCIHGDSRLQIFISSTMGQFVPPALCTVSVFLQNMGLVIADGLMVLCIFFTISKSHINAFRHVRYGDVFMHVKDIMSFALGYFSSFSSLNVVGVYLECSVNLPLYHAVLSIVSTVIFAIIYFQPLPQTHQAQTVNRFTGAMDASAAATSVLATSLICHHIYSRTAMARNRNKYKHVTDILIQSSVLYTTVMIVETILRLLDTGDITSSLSVILLEHYSSVLVNVASVSAKIHFIFIICIKCYLYRVFLHPSWLLDCLSRQVAIASPRGHLSTYRLIWIRLCRGNDRECRLRIIYKVIRGTETKNQFFNLMEPGARPCVTTMRRTKWCALSMNLLTCRSCRRGQIPSSMAVPHFPRWPQRRLGSW